MEPAKTDDQKAREAVRKLIGAATAGAMRGLEQPVVASAPASPAAPAIPPVPQTPPRRERGEDADTSNDLGGRPYDRSGRQQSHEMPGNWLLIALLVVATALVLVGWNIWNGGPKKSTPAPVEFSSVPTTAPIPTTIAVKDPVVSAIATISEPFGASDLVSSTNHWGTDIAQAIHVDPMGAVFAIKVYGSFDVCTNSATFGKELIDSGNFGSHVAEVSKDCENWLKEKPDAIYQVRTVGGPIRIFFVRRR